MILDEFNLTDYQLLQFEKYYTYLIRENEKVNLTSITSKNEVYIKHFYDSLKVKEILNFNEVSSICDIGSGAGFPGIPLKILYSHLKLTIIEPTNKRINFLYNLVNLLELKDVELITGRAEDEIINKRNYYDIVTARAVANLPILLELCTPYVKVNGYFISLKGSSFQEEINISTSALNKLNCIIEDKLIYELPESLGQRAILKVRKYKETNVMYPRKYAQIKKSHL